VYSVGPAAELLGVQPAYLRRLEAHDAVTPQRTAGGQRRYSRREIERIDAINCLMAEGMTLAGAMRIIALQAEIAELNRRLATRRSD
jgi:DNA-binding transcriptional MerR regulator